MEIRLHAVLSRTFGLAVIVGTTVGAGILRTPGDVAAQLPSLGLFFLAWLLGALYAFGGANVICELATLVPKSGGQYQYARRALGPYAGFLVGWNDWLSTSGSIAAVALVLAESAGVLVPALSGHERVTAAAVIAVLTVLVWRGVREGALAQQITSATKAGALLIIIVAAFWYAATHDAAAAPLPRPVPGGLALLAAMLIAMQSVIYTYDGWTGAIYFSEELRDPARDIPRATLGGLVAVTVIYLLLNLAMVLVAPLSALAGDPLAAGLVARTIFGEAGGTVLRLIIVIALLSAVNANLLLAPRVLFAMARDGLAPARATQVNDGGTPSAALLASAAAGILFLLTGTFNAVIAVLSFFFVATYAVSFASLFVLRVREPDTPRPYRARGHPWTTGVMLAGSVAFLAGTVWGDPRNGLIAAGLVALSYPVFRFTTRDASNATV